jgi:predicted porin
LVVLKLQRSSIFVELLCVHPCNIFHYEINFLLTLRLASMLQLASIHTSIDQGVAMTLNRKIALAVLATCAGTGAFAQSSVTLFGVVDVNARYVKNSELPSNITMNNSGLSSGRFGFRGVEDLGGGLKAGFWLESDVNADSGSISSTGKLFQRRSTVSLLSSFGEVRLGRDFTPASQLVVRYDPFGVIGLAGSNVTSRLPGAFASYYRHDNAIQYFTPVWSGLQVETMYALDESATTNAGRHMAARVVYDNGPLSLSGIYGTTTVNAAGAKLKQTGLGAAYDLGVVRLMGFYQRDEVPFGTYGTAVAGPESRFLLGVTVPVGRDQVRASWVRTDSRGGTAAFNGSDADKFSVGYIHNMSARTALYGTMSYVNNKGGANFSLAGGATGLATGGNSTGAEVGIRHSF